MSLDAALSIASSGVNTINRSIAVVSQNVANASTADYAREIAVQTSATAGGAGMGVRTQPSVRDVNTQLQSQTFLQNATVGGLLVRQKAVQQLDAVQGTPGGGTDLASRVGALQDAFSALQGDPSNQAQQSQVVTAAQNLTQQINALSASYQVGRQNAQDGLVAGVVTLNETLTSIGSLTDQIIQLRAAGLSTADLENQRDAAKSALSQVLSVKFVDLPNGDMQAITGNGLSLPIHATAPFTVVAATMGATTSYPGGGVPGVMLNGADVTTALGGGQLGAQITLRDTTFPTDQAELDEFAQTLSTRFDQQGLRLFTDPSGNVPTATGPLTQSGYVGYAGTITVNPGVVTAPSLVRDGTQAVAGSTTGASAFTPNPSGGPSGFTGLITRVLDNAMGTEAQSGVAQTNPATSGLGPTGTLSASYAMPGDLAGFATSLVAAQSQESATTSAATTDAQALQTTLQTALATADGVDIDTEMSNMVALQNAYGANAKIIATIQTMFTAILDMVQ